MGIYSFAPVFFVFVFNYFLTTMDDDEVVAVFPNGFRILVVDNDLSFLETAKVMLSSCHYKGRIEGFMHHPHIFH